MINYLQVRSQTLLGILRKSNVAERVMLEVVKITLEEKVMWLSLWPWYQRPFLTSFFLLF